MPEKGRTSFTWLILEDQALGEYEVKLSRFIGVNSIGKREITLHSPLYHQPPLSPHSCPIYYLLESSPSKEEEKIL